ncbi:MAG: hypothetical protein PHW56_01045 [Methanosarcinaceae archaeon]|nr:hypothetical protein [Methanosarcinaceae archaeon]
MKEPRKQTVQKITKICVILAVLLTALSIGASPALGDDDEDDVNFLMPNYGFTVDYYRSYGEPEIQACVVGDPEFSRGEIADIQVKLVNKGIAEGFRRLYVNQSDVDDTLEEALALDEMEEEEECTTARNIQATLIPENEYFEVEPTTSVRTVDELETGHSKTLRFTIKVDGDTPAGAYEFRLPVSYEYQSNVRTATAAVVQLGLTDTEYTREYSKKNTSLTLPVSIEEEAKFEVAKVSGSLKQGESSRIEVTYKNSRETTAKDAMARIIVMSPLSSEKSIVRLGDVGPGESKTASFEISTEPDAVVKRYGIDSEIRYIDDEGEIKFSENLKVNAPMEASEKKFSVLGIAIILIILVGIFQIVNTFRNRKKYSDENASGDDNE